MADSNLVNLSGTNTRRSFLKSLALGPPGVVGIDQAIKSATGETPDGVPLVLTRDLSGRPKRVRYIPKQHHEVLQLVKPKTVDKLKGRSQRVQGLRITDTGKQRAKLRIYVDKVTRQTNKSLPNRLAGHETVLVEKDLAQNPTMDSCPGKPSGSRVGDEVSTLEGGYGIDLMTECKWVRLGTITTGVYDDQDAMEYILSAGHVLYPEVFFNGADPPPNDYSYHPSQAGRQVGLRVDRGSKKSVSTQEDCAVVAVFSDNIDVGNTVVKEIWGHWSFSGLEYETDQTDIPVQYGGVRNDVDDAFCYDALLNANSDALSYHEFRVRDSPDSSVDTTDMTTRVGDSGLPFIDNHSDFVGLHAGRYGGLDPIPAAGPAAGTILNTLDIQFINPDV